MLSSNVNITALYKQLVSLVVISLTILTSPTCGQTEGDTGYDYIESFDYDEETALGYEPSFDAPVINVTVVAGQSVLLPCLVDNLGKYKISWQSPNFAPLTYEDRYMHDDHRISLHRPPHSREWNLRIDGVRWEDRGSYRCTVNTNPVRSKLVHLHVKVPASIIDELSSNDVNVQEGETVALICNVTGIPYPEVTWFRRPTNSPLSERDKLGITGEVVLIQNVSRYCDDIYECEANNGIFQPVSRQMRVTVQFSPEVKLRNSRQGHQVGKSTILDCFVTANPQEEAYWEKDGRRVLRTQRHKLDAYNDNDDEKTITLSLRIDDLALSDFGHYRCVAKNRFGRDDKTMLLYHISDQLLETSQSPSFPSPSPSLPTNNVHQTSPSKTTVEGKGRELGFIENIKQQIEDIIPAHQSSRSSAGSFTVLRNRLDTLRTLCPLIVILLVIT